jgi:glucose/arabinose dehydrogenase
LYIAVGDGGFANDLYDNAQNLAEPLGSILRIDVDRKGDDKPYAIPADNPFVGRADALPEIFASGLRNVWRFAFDRETGVCWAGDVGQNLYEEINLITAGGNYGWNRREGLHPFGAAGVGPTDDMIDPIWEYHHDTGKSITGGHVYRGKRLPELQGAYLYADYVTGVIWALRYDGKEKRVTANQLIPGPQIPVLSFGEDEAGEVYVLASSPTGEGIFRFNKAAAKSTGGE